MDTPERRPVRRKPVKKKNNFLQIVQQIVQKLGTMNKRQLWSLIFLVLFAVIFVAEIVAVVSILRLDMLPGILEALIILLFLVYDIVVANFMFLRGRRITKRNAKRIIRKRRIIACVLVMVVFCGSSVISRVTKDVYKTLQAVQVDEQTEFAAVTRTVFVRTHDKAQTLEDAKNYEYGIVVHFDDENTQQAVTAIETQLGTTIKTVGFSSVFEMADSLLNGELDAMILNSGYLSILEADGRYSKFSSLTRVLADVEIEGNGEELDGEGLLLNAEVDIAENGKLKPFVLYISGSDSRVNSMHNNRSDVNILVVVHPENRQILLVNTPRDYFVPSTEQAGAMEKLSHAGVFGVQASIGSLEALYDTEVDYYVQASFGGVEGLVDAVGGVTVYSDEEFVLYEDVGVIYKGENYLNGELALAYARTRKGVEGGDLGRGNHQMEIIEAIVNKATSGTTIINNYSAIMESVDGLFIMNIPQQLISALIKEQLADMSGWNIAMFSTYGEGGYGEVYSAQGYSVYVIVPDEAVVKKASKLIDMALAGEIITEDVINSTT